MIQLYTLMYDLFKELIGSFGNDSVEAGVINMMNEWNSKSDLQSSFDSFSEGMSTAGAELKSVKSVFAKYRTKFVPQNNSQK
jgi:hypothetical protein